MKEPPRHRLETMQKSLFRSYLSNWVGLALAILIGFFLSPYIVRTLGPERYGVWTIIASLAAQLIVLDFGVRHTLVRFVAQFLTKDNQEGLCAFVSSCRTVLLLSGAAAFLLLLALVPFFDDLFSVPQSLADIAALALFILALDAGLELLFGLYHGTLLGCERYDLVQGINVTRLLLHALLAVVVLSLGGGLVGLALATLASRGLQRYLLVLNTKKQLPFLRLSFSLSNRKDLKQVAHYGMGVCLIALATRAIAHIDTLVVGLALTPQDVAVYGVTLLVIDYFRLLLQSSGTVLTPRLSSLQADKDSETTRLLLLKWIRYSHLLSISVGVPLLVCGKDFLLLWIGQEYNDSGVLLQLLTLPFFFTVPSLVFHNYLLAHAKHYLSAKLLVLEAVANVLLSLYLVGHYGMVGVALGTVIPAVIFSATLLPVTVCQMTGISLFRYLWESLGKLLPLGAIHFGVVLTLSQYFGSKTWPSFIFHNAISLLVFLLICYFFLFNAKDRSYIRRRVFGNSQKQEL